MVARLDLISAASRVSPPAPAQESPSIAVHNSETPIPTTPPVFLIRDVASDIGLRQPPCDDESFVASKSHMDVISKGFLTTEQAISLLDLYANPSLFENSNLV